MAKNNNQVQSVSLVDPYPPLKQSHLSRNKGVVILGLGYLANSFSLSWENGGGSFSERRKPAVSEVIARSGMSSPGSPGQ